MADSDDTVVPDANWYAHQAPPQAFFDNSRGRETWLQMTGDNVINCMEEAIASIIVHSVFRQADSGAKCLQKFARLVEVARKAVLDSPSVWKGNLSEKEKKN